MWHQCAVETFGEALAGTDRPLIIASGVLAVAPGRLATENDAPTPPAGGGLRKRMATARLTVDLASRGIRSSVLRLPPTVHGPGDQGFVPMLVRIACEKGVSGYIGDGSTRWPAVHRLDAARLCRLVIDASPAGSAVVPEDAPRHFGWMAAFLGLDSPASSALTRERVGWEPTHPELLDDLEAGRYFRSVTV